MVLRDASASKNISLFFVIPMWKVVTFHYESCLQIFRDIEANKREKDATLEICANIECWCFHGVKFVQHSEWDSESTIPPMQIDKKIQRWFSKRQTRVMSKSQSTSVWLISWEVDYLQPPLVTDALASTHRPLILEQFHPCLTRRHAHMV